MSYRPRPILTPEKEHFVDELFDLAGVRRVPRAYDRENALCCANIKLLLANGDPLPDQERNVIDARESGTQRLPTVLPGYIARMALGETGLPSPPEPMGN